MAKVITLPTAALATVENHRRAGSYGKKIASFHSAAQRRQCRERPAEPAAREPLPFSLADVKRAAASLLWMVDQMEMADE